MASKEKSSTPFEDPKILTKLKKHRHRFVVKNMPDTFGSFGELLGAIPLDAWRDGYVLKWPDGTESSTGPHDAAMIDEFEATLSPGDAEDRASRLSLLVVAPDRIGG